MKKRLISILLVGLLSVSVIFIPSINIESKAADVGIEKAIEWALGIARDESHGYDQNNRWGPSDYDCSSLVITAFRKAGFVLDGASYTGNMKSVFVNEGFVWIGKSDLGGLNDETDTQYLQRGDILLNEATHTEIYLGGNNAVGAHCNEFGGAKGGKPGDQTGSEICERYTNKGYFSAHKYDGVLRLDTKSYNVETPCNIYLEVSKSDGSVHRTEPRKAAPTVGERFLRGTTVHAVAKKINEYSHLWYKLDDNSWIYSGNVKTPTNYTITYDANGGTGAPSTQTKKKNETITISSVTPTKKWCRFDGWEDTANKVCINPGAKYSANKSTTLKAIWKSSVTYASLSKYRSEICLNDGSTDTITMTITGFLPKGSRIVPSTDNSLITCTASDISSKTVLNEGSATAKITINAKKPGDGMCKLTIVDSKGNPINYTSFSVYITKKTKVKFNANGGSGGPATQEKVTFKNLTLSGEVPTRKNYTFMGWSLSQSGNVPDYGPGDLIKKELNQDITLYAIWKEDYHIEHSWNASSKTLTITGYGDMAFYSQSNQAPWADYKNSAEKIVVSDGITSIGSYAFYGFNKVVSVEIPSSMNVIYNHAFSNCGKLASISVPRNCDVKEYAFAQCKSLTSVTKKAKKSTASFTAMADDNMEIGSYAFVGCESLQTFDLSNVDYIGEGAFSGCTSIDNIVIPEGIETIENITFFNCQSLENVTVPDSVTEISDGAFEGCASITSVDLSDNVTEIGDLAFSGCKSVTEVSIPDSVDVIGASAFSNCTSLTCVSLPDEMNYLGDGMFSGCSSLSSIEIPDGISSLGNGTFLACTSLTSIELPDSIYTLGDNVFADCTSLKDVTIGDSLASIDSYAFYGCTSIEEIDIPSSVSELGTASFAMCTSLNSIDIPNSVASIGAGAFMGCSSLKDVTIEEGAEVTIGEAAFAECTSLESITLPESTVSVDPQAFVGCSSTASVTCYSETQAFEDVASTSTICNVLYHPKNMELNKTSANLNKGQTLQLNAVFIPANTTNKNVSWETDGEDIATVTQNGLVTAVGSGVATITARSEDGCIEAICEVNCIIPVESITISSDDCGYYVGSVIDLYCEFNPESPTNIGVTWTSSNPSAVTVDEYGRIEIVGAGDSTITATSEEGNASDSIVVTGLEYTFIETINLNANELTLKPGESKQLTYTVLPEKSAGNFVYFYSEDESVVSVNQYGYMTAVGVGETKIICVGDEKESVCEVKVEEVTSTVELLSISVSSLPVKTTYNMGETLNTSGLVLTAYYSDGSSNSVTSGFLCSPTKLTTAGQQTITVTYQGKTTTFKVTVNPVQQQGKVHSVSVNDASVNYKGSITLNPSIVADEGASCTKTFTSSNPSVATVDNNGKVTSVKQSGLNRGSTVITCTVTDSYGNTVTDTCTVTVQFTWWQWIIKIVLFGWIWY